MLEGTHIHQNKVQKVRDKDRRLPGVPYLQTAAAPSGWYLIFYFTEKWGSIRVTYVPKRGPQAILQPPWPPSPLHVTGCPQLLSLSGGPSLKEDGANHLLPTPVSNLIFSCSQRGGSYENINSHQSWLIRRLLSDGGGDPVRSDTH